MALDADVQMPHYFELFDSIIYLGSQKKFKEQLEKASAATVEQLMTDDVKSVAPDDPARVAATLMHKHKFDRVPVVEDEAVVGHRHPARHHEDPGALSAGRTTARRRRGRPRGDPPQRPPPDARPPARRRPLRRRQGERRTVTAPCRRRAPRSRPGPPGSAWRRRPRPRSCGRPASTAPILIFGPLTGRGSSGPRAPAPRSSPGRRRSSTRPSASASACTSSSTPAWAGWACRRTRSATCASRLTPAASCPA